MHAIQQSLCGYTKKLITPCEFITLASIDTVIFLMFNIEYFT